MANMPRHAQPTQQAPIPSMLRPLTLLPKATPPIFPADHLLILQSFIPLTKTITVPEPTPGSNPEWVVEPLASAKNFHFHFTHPKSHEDMLHLLLALSRNPRFAMVLGRPTTNTLERQIASPTQLKTPRHSRQTDTQAATIESSTTTWWVSDVEGLIIPNLTYDQAGVAKIRQTLVENGLRELTDVRLIYQWTASAGKRPNEARIRLIAKLSEPTHLTDVAAWSARVSSLDQSIYRPAQLIYTALPSFNPQSANPIPTVDRIGILPGIHDDIKLPDLIRETNAPLSNQERQDQEDFKRDPILQALQKQGLLKTRSRPGVWEINCPWVDEHTNKDNQGAAYFQPFYAGRQHSGFNCLHAHCEHRTIHDLKQFLDPTLTQFQAASAGSTQELAEARAACDPSFQAPTHNPQAQTRSTGPATQANQPDPDQQPAPDEGKEDIDTPDLSDIDLSSTALPDLQRRYVYVADQDAFYDLLLHRLYRPEALARAYQYSFPTRTNLSKTLLDSHATVRATSIIYLPGSPPLVDYGKPASIHINAWQALNRPPAIPGPVDKWLGHCRWLVPIEEQLEHVWDWMAFTLQHQDVKINHALLMAGTSRNGKDTMFEPLKQALGINNVSEPNAEELKEAYTDFLWRRKLVVFQESENFDKINVENKLKPILAAPPTVLRIRAFGQGFYETPNLVQAIFFSNKRNAVKISKGDGRYHCVWIPATPKEKEYYEDLYAWYNATGLAHVHHWLLTRDISKFNPKAPAPMTAYKASLQELSMSGLEMMLKEDIDAGAPPMDRDIITLNQVVAHQSYPRINAKILSNALNTLNATNRKVRITSPTGKRLSRSLWCIRDQKTWAKRTNEAWLKEFTRIPTPGE